MLILIVDQLALEKILIYYKKLNYFKPTQVYSQNLERKSVKQFLKSI